MITQDKIPFYAKVALVFIGLFAFFYTMSIGQHIIIPIIYAAIFAILLNPIVNFLIRKGMNKIISISLVVFVALVALIGLLILFSSQMKMFSETYPQLKEKFALSSGELIKWISEKFNINQNIITTWIKENKTDAIDNFAFEEKITEAGRMLFVGMLIPVYVYLILYYKGFLLEFVRKLFRKEHQLSVGEVLTGTKTIIQSYVVGLFFELLIMSVLNAVGLLILGIPYAIILGVIGAFLNIIPYLGGIIAIALPMIIAYVTKDSITYPMLVLVIYLFIQFIDNNYIVPFVVAKRVKINALISVIVVIIGGTLWGISGMFLSIPLTAIVKVIFDHIETLKPWGFLLGDIVPTVSKHSFPKLKKTLQIPKRK